MRKIFLFLICLSLIILPVLAAESDEDSVDISAMADDLDDLNNRLAQLEAEKEQLSNTVFVLSVENASLSDKVGQLSEDNEALNNALSDLADISSSDPVSDPIESVSVLSSNRSSELDPAPVYEDGLSGTLVRLLGDYQPRTQTVTSDDGTTYTEIIPGLAGLDMPWIASLILFVVCIYCVLRICGGILRWS